MISTPHRQTAITLIDEAVIAGAWRAEACAELEISDRAGRHAAQEGTAWNGHFGCMCYHPLFVFNQFGHLERCDPRPGNVHSSGGWEVVLKPVIARYADRHLMRFFREDAAFAIPALGDGEGSSASLR